MSPLSPRVRTTSLECCRRTKPAPLSLKRWTISVDSATKGGVMAIGGSQSLDEPFSEMNTTPLIDVMLVLLIMFIITVPMMNHSVNLNVAGVKGPQPSLAPIQVGIDFDGTLTMNG